jgi:hypothetical protein
MFVPIVFQIVSNAKIKAIVIFVRTENIIIQAQNYVRIVSKNVKHALMTNLANSVLR